jgi:hypothetical protein
MERTLFIYLFIQERCSECALSNAFGYEEEDCNINVCDGHRKNQSQVISRELNEERNTDNCISAGIFSAQRVISCR